MYWIFNLFIFLSGLVVGSFLNCLIYRLKEGKGFFRGRSFCPQCKHVLTWPDLIPVLSFFVLGRKCRYCQKPISWQYPLVELATGLLFVLIMNYELISFENILASLFMLLVSCFLIVIFVYDFKYYIIPDQIIYPATALTFLYQLFRILPPPLNKGWATQPIENGLWLNFGPLFNPLLSALLASAFFLAIVLVSQGRWMGVGDIKLAFFMGLFLGYPKILVALFLAFSLGALIGIILILTGKKTLKAKVPFAPFLVTGTFMALFWGEKIINWYLNLIYL